MFPVRILILLSVWFTLPATAQKKINVLFVGNSLTYFNNLPELVKRIAACDSVEMLYRSIALPNYALVDHWDDGKVQQEIKSGVYDYAIVQQGPSSQTEGRTYLLEYGLKFDSLCDQQNTRMAVFMVWPSKIRSSDFDGVFNSYKLLADSARAIFCPAGKAWLAVWENYSEFTLYDEDNFHPEYRGSLLAAMVIYGSIMKKKNLGFIDHLKFRSNTFVKADFKILVRAAQQTLAERKSKK